jgi:hypothetical protein
MSGAPTARPARDASSAAGAPATSYVVARDVAVPAEAEAVFEFLDDHRRLAAHMERRSWRLAFGSLASSRRVATDGTEMLEWNGRVFGLPLHAVEAVVERRAPVSKRWETRGAARLWVVGGYAMGFRILPRGDGSLVRIELEYTLPERGLPRLLGHLLGHGYARWSVQRMIDDVGEAFPPDPV